MLHHVMAQLLLPAQALGIWETPHGGDGEANMENTAEGPSEKPL